MSSPDTSVTQRTSPLDTTADSTHTGAMPNLADRGVSLDVIDAPLADLKPWGRNPRRVKPARLEQLKRMLVDAPEMLRARPLIALPDGTVIAGNQRLLAASELGWESIPTVFADLDEATAIEWAFRDNNPVGETDDDLAAELLAELGARGRTLDMTGFAPVELQALLRRVAPPVDPDAVPEPPKMPRSVRGEVYELGPHRLMCGDACDEEDVRALFVGSLMAGIDAVEVLWTDPPYGVGYVGKTSDAMTIENDDAATLPGLLAAAFANADKALAAGARFYIAAPPGPLNLVFRLAIQSVGWRLHEGLVWVKNAMVLGHSDYHLQHEDVLYGWKPGVGRAGRGNHAGSRWYGDHSQTSVFHVDRPSRSEEHPTMKPAALIQEHLVNSSLPGDAVYDPFAGSGSTMIACEQTGRRCYAMEIDPVYCDVIRQRYADYVQDQTWAP